MLRADTPMSWPVLDREVLGEGHVSTFVNETIQTPDGQQIKRQYLTHPGACAETHRVFLARGISETSRPEGFVLEGEEAAMTWSWEPRADLVDAVLRGDTSSPTLVAGILALETARLGGRLDDLRPADAPWPLRER